MHPRKFGAFSGVFTPSILTILGVIMYLRLPMIVGEAGLLPAIGIVVIAHIISFATGLSVSSIATDKKVQAGGTYYIISRSLGLPIGGTLGLALFVGLSFSVSLYLIGFAESFLGYWGWEVNINNIRIAGSIILLAVTTITFISTSLAIRTQYFIMAAIVLSLASILLGNHEFTPEVPLIRSDQTTVPLMVLFGIFFPAVTGFEAGVSMSGDLRDPKRAIPLGTIAAVLTGFVVYIMLVFFFAYTVDSRMLANDPQVLTRIAWIPELVIAGIWGATLSSALGSILGAPRILQATASDRITPKAKFFARGYGSSSEPRNALLLTFIIAEAGIMIGELDVIARIVSIFFITTYGFLNLSSAFEYWTSPDFRPEFRISPWISMIGSMACFVIMIQLDLLAALGATLILGLVFLAIKRKELTLESGDAWSGIWASLVNAGIKRLNREHIHPRNWRPNILMFSGRENERPYMVELGLAIAGKLGILTDINLIEHREGPLPLSENTQQQNENGDIYFRHNYHCRDVYTGIEEHTRLYGFSGLEPNTVLMGWSRQPANKERFVEVLRGVLGNSYNLLFLDYKEDKKYGDRRSLDIWWSGTGKNLSFVLSMLRHFTSAGGWHGASLRLLVVKNNDQPIELIYNSIERVVERYRIRLEIKVIDNYVEKAEEAEIIARESLDADLVILDISDDSFRNLNKHYNRINTLLNLLGSVLIVRGAGLFEDIEVGLAQPGREQMLGKSVQEDMGGIPALRLSAYPEVAAEVSDTAKEVEAVVSGLFENAIVSCAESGLQLLQELSGALEATVRELSRMQEFSEKHRRVRLLKKARNDLHYRLKEAIRDFNSKALQGRADLLAGQIEVFDRNMQGIVRSKPAKLRIVYFPEDIQPAAADKGNVRFAKWHKRVTQKWTGKMPPGAVLYRKTARYFLYDGRHRWLQKQLNVFLGDEIRFYQAHKKWIRLLLDIVDEAEKGLKKSSLDQDDLFSKLNEMEDQISVLLEEKKSYVKGYRYLWKEDLNKTFQHFNNYLERIHGIGASERRTRRRKHFKQLVRGNMGFGDRYEQALHLALNSLELDLYMRATQSRIGDLVEEYINDFRDKVKRYYLKKLHALRQQIAQLRTVDPESKAALSFEVDRELQFFEDYQILHRDIIALIDQLPEVITIASDPSTLNKHIGSGSMETTEIPLRKIGTYFLQSRFANPLEQAIDQSVGDLYDLVEQSREVHNLLAFSLENPGSDEGDDPTVSIQRILDTSVKKISEQQEKTEKIIANLHADWPNMLAESFEPLGIARIRKSTSELSNYLRDYQGRKVISRFGNVGRQLSEWSQQKLVKVLYSRSEGVLLAKRLQTGRQQYSLSSRLLDVNEMVSSKPKVIKHLPPYYVNLFSGRSNIGKEFWVDRPVEMAQAKKAFQRYENGRKGGILVVGERNSGKTLLSKYIAHENYREQHVYEVFPPSGGSLREEDFAAALRKASGSFGGIHQVMASEPAGRVWILHDLELWWERSEQGMGLVSMFGDIIDRYSGKFMFIANINPFALAFIKRLIQFENYFIETINCRAFDAEELRDLILRRHETSGLKLTYHRGKKELLSEVKMATLFHDYFSLSKGNPGVALNAWLANIRQVYGEFLQIARPDVSGTAVFRELPDDWYVIAAALALHKRLDTQRLLHLTGMEPSDLDKILLAMQRAAVIEERVPGLHVLNRFMEPYILAVLKEEELI